MVREQNKEKPLEIDMGWISEGTNWAFTAVPEALVAEADRAAQASLEGVFIPFNVADDTEAIIDPEVARGGVSERTMEVN